LHEQIDRRDLAMCVVGINQELLQPLQLKIEIVETEGDLAMVLVGHDQTITF
jgi:hypothetical protein